MALDSLLRVVHRELVDGELPPVVREKRPQLLAALLLCHGLHMLDRIRSHVLRRHERHPHVPCGGVDQQQEVAPAAGIRRRDGATQVAVDELQQVLRAVLGLRRERGAAVLGDDARVAELGDVVDLRQPARHAVLGQSV